MVRCRRRIAWCASLVVSASVLVACGGSGISLSLRGTIPANATAIKVRSALTAPRMYDAALDLLREKGFRLRESDAVGMRLATESKAVGTSHSELRLVLRVVTATDGSLLVAAGEFFPLGEGDWRPIAFRESDLKARTAFEELVMLVGQLPNLEVMYEQDQPSEARRGQPDA